MHTCLLHVHAHVVCTVQRGKAAVLGGAEALERVAHGAAREPGPLREAEERGAVEELTPGW